MRTCGRRTGYVLCATRRKITELEEELRIVGNNMKSLEISEQEVRPPLLSSPLLYSIACERSDPIRFDVMRSEEPEPERLSLSLCVSRAA